jgi:hypothetical protein
MVGISLALVEGLGSGGGAVWGATWNLALNPSVKHQVIEGWGAHLGGSTDTATRNAYRDLGMNILRMDMPKDVLTASSTDWATRVPLGTDLNANIAKFNFSASSVTGQAATAQWLAVNVPNFKLIGDAWTPPNWMKGPTGKTSQWVGNPSTDSPSFPTPWLSNTYNHWYNGPGGSHFLSQTGDSIGGRVRTEDANNLAEYGRYFAAWVKGFENQYGLKFSNISLQNESGFENPFDSCTMTVGPQKSDGTYPTDYNQYARCLAAVRDAFAQQGVTTPHPRPTLRQPARQPGQPVGVAGADGHGQRRAKQRGHKPEKRPGDLHQQLLPGHQRRLGQERGGILERRGERAGTLGELGPFRTRYRGRWKGKLVRRNR